MFPYFTIFGTTIATYSLVGLVAVFVGTAAAGFRGKKYSVTRSDTVYAAVFAGFGLLLGGVFLYALVQLPRLLRFWEHLASTPAQIPLFLFGGMVFYGGLFGAVFGLWAYSKVFSQNFGNILCLAVPVLPLAHGIMRLGCFAAGCCYGLPHDTLGIAFTRSVAAPNGIPLLPVQLMEAAMNFALFAIIWQFSKKDRESLHLLCFYGIFYAVGRFALEFFRGDAARGFVFFLSTSQFISILVIAACAVVLARNRCCKEIP